MLAKYYRQFVKDFAKITKSIYKMILNDKERCKVKLERETAEGI